jgi:hypothetical protein
MKTYVIAYNLMTIDIKADSEAEALEMFANEVGGDYDHIWEEEAAY